MNNIFALTAKAIEYGLLDRFNKVLAQKDATFTNPSKAVRLTGISYLMGINSSAKAEKNLKYNYQSGTLYLSAANNSGVNVCPKATTGCSKACLYFTGRNGMKTKDEIISRNNAAQFLKTALFFINRNYFMDWLDAEIASLVRNAGTDQVCVRLNGTSDINITTFKNSNGELLVEKYSQIQFYDYTKVPAYLEVAKRFPNYDLTFSYGGPENLNETLDAIVKGHRIAAAFEKRNWGGHFPDTFLGRAIVDGDLNDLTFKQPKNVIYGLKAKYTLKKVSSIWGNDFFVTNENYIA